MDNQEANDLPPVAEVLIYRTRLGRWAGRVVANGRTYYVGQSMGLGAIVAQLPTALHALARGRP